MSSSDSEVAASPGSETSSVANGEQYEVKKILGQMLDRKGDKFYLIKWSGTGPNGEDWSEDKWDTLVAEKDLHCPDLLAHFKNSKKKKWLTPEQIKTVRAAMAAQNKRSPSPSRELTEDSEDEAPKKRRRVIIDSSDSSAPNSPGVDDDKTVKQEEPEDEEMVNNTSNMHVNPVDLIGDISDSSNSDVQEVVTQPIAPVVRAQPSVTAPNQYIDVEDYEDDSDEELDSDDDDEDSEEEGEEEEDEEDDEHDGEGNKVYDENGKFMYTIKTMAEGEKSGYELGHEGILIEHDTFTDQDGKTVRLFRVIFEELKTSQFIEEDEVKRYDPDAYGVYMARQIEIEEEKEKLRDIRLRLHLLNSE